MIMNPKTLFLGCALTLHKSTYQIEYMKRYIGGGCVLKRKSCKCCSYPDAHAHHAGFNVCRMCTPVESEEIVEGPIKRDNSIQNARYHLYTYKCGSPICKKRAVLGTFIRVIEWI